MKGKKAKFRYFLAFLLAPLLFGSFVLQSVHADQIALPWVSGGHASNDDQQVHAAWVCNSVQVTDTQVILNASGSYFRIVRVSDGQVIFPSQTSKTFPKPGPGTYQAQASDDNYHWTNTNCEFTIPETVYCEEGQYKTLFDTPFTSGTIGPITVVVTQFKNTNEPVIFKWTSTQPVVAVYVFNFDDQAQKFTYNYAFSGSGLYAPKYSNGYLREIKKAKFCWYKSSPTPTQTSTSTSTSTATATSTGTSTATSTGTATATSTGTSTATSTGTATATSTGTSTATSTGTATDTPTSTPTGTATATMTPTPSDTVKSSVTPTPTGTSTNTATPTATNTEEIPTGTPTGTATSTSTATEVVDPTPTLTPSVTPSPTETNPPLADTPTTQPTESNPTATNTPPPSPTPCKHDDVTCTLWLPGVSVPVPPAELVQFSSCGDPYFRMQTVGHLSAYDFNCGGERYPKLLEEAGYVVIKGVVFGDGWGVYPNINRPKGPSFESHVWVLLSNGMNNILVENAGSEDGNSYPGPLTVSMNGVKLSFEKDVPQLLDGWLVTRFDFLARGLAWQAFLLERDSRKIWVLQETQGSLRTGWVEVQTPLTDDLTGLWADAARNKGVLPEDLTPYILTSGSTLDVAAVAKAAAQ